MDKEVDFELSSNSNERQLASSVRVVCDNGSHRITIAEVDAKEVVRSISLDKKEGVHSILAFAARAIVVRTWLAISPHVPSTFAEAELVNALTETVDAL